MTTVIPNPITPKVVSRMTPALVAGGRKRYSWWMLTPRVKRAAPACSDNEAWRSPALMTWRTQNSYGTPTHTISSSSTRLMSMTTPSPSASRSSERPEQMVTFLVGQPHFLSPSPMQDIVAKGKCILTAVTAHSLLTTASSKFSRGTGIMNCASQISTRRALHRLQSADRPIDKQRQEVSFGEAVRRAGGE
jgi:hypothetical protein